MSNRTGNFISQNSVRSPLSQQEKLLPFKIDGRRPGKDNDLVFCNLLLSSSLSFSKADTVSVSCCIYMNEIHTHNIVGMHNVHNDTFLLDSSNFCFNIAHSELSEELTYRINYQLLVTSDK